MAATNLTTIPTLIPIKLTPLPTPVIAAPLYIALSTLFLLLHALTLTVFAAHAEYRNLSCFRIMFSIGLFKSIQLVCIGLNGERLVMLFDRGNSSGVMYAITLYAIFSAVGPQHLMLAINRLVVLGQMRSVTQSNGVSPKKYVASTPQEHSLVLVGLCICWLLAFFYVSFTGINTTLTSIVRVVRLNTHMVFYVFQYSVEYAPYIVSALVLTIYLAIVSLLIKRVGMTIVNFNNL